MAAGDYARAVDGWADHLRGGGTSTWAAWRTGSHAPANEPAARTRPVPDGLHLEVLRRLNLVAARLGRRAPSTVLVERVLGTGAPGRGMLDPPLPWTTAAAYGTPAREPEALPVGQLLRLAVGVLAHLAPSLPETPARVVPDPLPLPGRRRFRLHGSPTTADVVRRSLREQGLAETSWRATHVVLAQPLEAMLAEQWAARVRSGGTVGWPALWRRTTRRGALPAPVDVVAITRRLERAGQWVHVVLGADATEVAATTARLLGARPTAVVPARAAALDVVRRVNELTPLTGGTDRVGDVAARLLDAMAGLGSGTALPDVPDESLPWARGLATSYAEELRRADCPVHGDPAVLLPAEHRPRRRLDRPATLELALETCLHVADLLEERA